MPFETIKLNRLQYFRHILYDEHLRLQSIEKPNIMLPKLIARIVEIPITHTAQRAESLARRPSDENVDFVRLESHRSAIDAIPTPHQLSVRPAHHDFFDGAREHVI